MPTPPSIPIFPGRPLAALAPATIALLLACPPAAAAPACPDTLEVLLPRAAAVELSLTTGDVVGVRARRDGLPCPARVAGVYRPPDDPARLTADRPRVLFHLPQLARLTDRDRTVDRFSVALAGDADTAAVAADLQALMPGTRVLATEAVARESSTAFEVVRRFHRAIGIVTLAAGSVFLACIMTLRVQQRRSEVAALRLVGISRSTLLRWVTAESAVVASVGGLLGLGLGRLAAGVINAHYQRVYDTGLVFAAVTPEILGGVLLLSVVLGVGAGTVAGLRLLSLDALSEAGR